MQSLIVVQKKHYDSEHVAFLDPQIHRPNSEGQVLLYEKAKKRFDMGYEALIVQGDIQEYIDFIGAQIKLLLSQGDGAMADTVKQASNSASAQTEAVNQTELWQSHVSLWRSVEKQRESLLSSFNRWHKQHQGMIHWQIVRDCEMCFAARIWHFMQSIDYAGAATVVHEVTEPLVVTQDARIIQDGAVVPDSAATQNSVVDQDGMIMHDGETTQGSNLVQGHAATQDSRLRSGEVLEPEAAEPRATSQQRRAESALAHESILGLEPQADFETAEGLDSAQAMPASQQPAQRLKQGIFEHYQDLEQYLSQQHSLFTASDYHTLMPQA